MNNSQIRYEIFLKVAELGNITMAAESLSYTQSGVSHAIAAMEREAGCTLFHRSKFGVTLTEQGKQLVPLVQELINRQHALDQAMDALSNRVAGTLRVGSFTSFTAVWMPKLIRDFTAQFPEVNIELTNGTYRDIEDRIQEGRLDCGFLSAIENDPLDFTPLFEDPMLVIAATDHPLAKEAALPLKVLKKFPLISQFQGSDHDVQQIFKKAKIHPQTKYILDDDISVMGMVSQGEGIALMPELMLRTASFELSAVPLDPPQTRTIGLAALPVRETTLLVRTFTAFCKSYPFPSTLL
ncbi:MAG: LysR family transcriptional regulator [Firmicutes bacterium]|nr:LysR family transcriptional regulator [Bacillota bacterium]